MISYAQNFEDVMLWRALKHIERGFYIDVGAAWPDEHSVTRAFYENGWCGINIEPNLEFFQRLEECRTRDKNLQIALADSDGVAVMNRICGTGLSTLDDSVAKKHIEDGWQIEREEVPVRTLTSVWQQYLSSEEHVHFLKVDVEGLEAAVLRGNDWKRNRPWIVVVEATAPMSTVESYQPWEQDLLSNGYRFVYADGLNRFYLSSEHEELCSAFRYPPNVFDDFVLIQSKNAEVKAQQAEAKAQQAEAKAQQAEVKAQQAEVKTQQAEAKAQQAEVKAQQAEHQLQAIYDSTSWRITAPPRWVINQLRLLRPLGLKSRIATVLHKLPVNKIKGSREGGGSLHHPQELNNLSPRARQIYHDLKEVVDHDSEENK